MVSASGCWAGSPRCFGPWKPCPARARLSLWQGDVGAAPGTVLATDSWDPAGVVARPRDGNQEAPASRRPQLQVPQTLPRWSPDTKYALTIYPAVCKMQVGGTPRQEKEGGPRHGINRAPRTPRERPWQQRWEGFYHRRCSCQTLCAESSKGWGSRRRGSSKDRHQGWQSRGRQGYSGSQVSRARGIQVSPCRQGGITWE